MALSSKGKNTDKHKARNKIYLLFAGWEVRIVKNCDWGLENEAAGRGQHFQSKVTVFHYTDQP